VRHEAGSVTETSSLGGAACWVCPKIRDRVQQMGSWGDTHEKPPKREATLGRFADLTRDRACP
jgi:hypothetical protein